ISSALCITFIILEMDKDNADCGPLLEGTTSALSEEAMQMLLISTQRTNLALCIKYAVQKYVHWYINSQMYLRYWRSLVLYIKRESIVRRSLMLSKRDCGQMQRYIAYWFPHIKVRKISTPS